MQNGKESLRVVVGEVGQDYPSTLPLLALSCPSMKYAFVLYLTEKMAEKSAEFVEMAMVHSLIDALMELLYEAAQPDFQLPSLHPFAKDSRASSLLQLLPKIRPSRTVKMMSP